MPALALALLLAAAPKADRATVLDDFLALSDAPLGIPADAAARKAALTVTDLQHGYLEGRSGARAFEVALFVRGDGKHFLGIEVHTDRVCDDLRPPRFFVLSDGGWVEATDAVWPRLDVVALDAYVRAHVPAETLYAPQPASCRHESSDVSWTLPRVGTTVLGTTAVGKLRIELSWDRASATFHVTAPKELAR